MNRLNFEVLVEKIFINISRDSDDMSFLDIFDAASRYNIYNVEKGNVALSLLFDYSSLNEYAKIIVDNTQAFFNNDYCDFYDYRNNISIGEYVIKYDADFSEKEKTLLIKELIRLGEYNNRGEYARLIFWSLLIMAVDKETAKKKIVEICEYAKLFDITKEEFIDIFNVVKSVLEYDVEVEDEWVYKIFVDIL